MKIIVFFILYFIAVTNSAQLFSINLNSSKSVCGNTSFESINENNPSTLTNLRNGIAKIDILPSKFGMNELTNSSLMAASRIYGDIFLGLKINGIFNDLFNDYSSGFVISNKLYEKISIGAEIEYNRFEIKGYESHNLVMLNFGSLIELTDKINAGFLVTNLNRAYRQYGKENVEQTARFGIGTNLIQDFYLNIDAVVNISRNTGFLISSKYDVENYLSLRLSYLTSPKQFDFGVNAKILEDVYLNYNFYMQNELGNSHGIALYFVW